MNLKENKFKVGDRVMVYVSIQTGFPVHFSGYIKGVNGEGILRVIGDSLNEEHTVWPQQCRRLVSKKKKPGDEIWLSRDITDYGSSRLKGVPQQSYSWDAVPGWIKYKRCT